MKKYFGILISIYGVFLCSAPVQGRCPDNYQEIMGSCFLLLDVAANYLDAIDVCQNFGGNLAIVNNCNLMSGVSSYLSSYNLGSAEVWIGATDVVTNGLWEWRDGSYVQMGAPFWGRADVDSTVTEPSGGAAENCATMATGAGLYFQDVDCNNYAGMAPLCQIAPVGGSCPPPYVNVGYGCFHFLYTVDVTWDDARRLCQSSLGDLAVFSDCQLMSIVDGYLGSTGFAPSTGYWIGGTDVEVEGTWKWINGQKMAMGAPFWGRAGTGPLQPDYGSGIEDEHCLSMMGRDKFLFNDLNCSRVEKFLCQADLI